MVYGVKGLGKVQKDTNSVIMVIDSSGCFVDKSENSMYSTMFFTKTKLKVGKYIMIEEKFHSS